MSTSEAHIEKSPSKNECYGIFSEAARWDVICGHTVIGQVWKGVDHHGKTCWMVDAPFLSRTLQNSDTGIGYSRSTRITAVADLVSWYKNCHRSFEFEDVRFHCAAWYDRGHRLEAHYVAEFPDGHLARVNTTLVIEPRPHSGLMTIEGWYANTNRGGQVFHAVYCASEEEAISLLIDDARAVPSKTRRPAYSPSLPVRYQGSLAEHDVIEIVSPRA